MHTPTLLERTHDSVTVAWPPVTAADTAATYELQMQTDEGEWTTLSSTLGRNIAKKKNLSPDNAYAFRARAKTGAEWSEWSNASDTLTPLSNNMQQMGPPTMLTSDANSITIQWNPVSEATGYHLRYRASTDAGWTEVGATITNCSAKKKNLQHGHSYVFSVTPTGVEGYEYSVGSETLQVLEDTGVTLVAANNQTFPSSVLRNKVVGLYFSAHWCGPCRKFTPQLAALYNEAQAAGLPFEILFVSADQTEREFRKYLSEMPWKAYDFDDSSREQLQDAYKVSGIPRLVILKPDGSILEGNAVGQPLSLATIQQWVRQSGL